MAAPFKDTDDLLAAAPTHEDNLWEWKSAKLFADKGALRKELGVQASAFANGGGGNLVLGIDDKTRVPESCPKTVGREAMVDHLFKLIQHSVDRPLNGHKIHEIPIAGKPGEVVYLIEIPDSLMAPHQTREEPLAYYWRAGGAAKAAPHRHIELLLDRVSRSVIELARFDPTIETTVHQGNQAKLVMNIDIEVENVSNLMAQPWNVYITKENEDYPWIHFPHGPSAFDGISLVQREPLFPRSMHKFRVTLHCNVDPSFQDNDYRTLGYMLAPDEWTVQVFTQNYAGPVEHFAPVKSLERIHLVPIMNQLKQSLETVRRYGR